MHVVTLFLTRVTICITILFQYNSNLMGNTTEFIKTWNTVNCADNYIIKIGNTVFFNVAVYNTSAVTADNYLLTFPEGYRPTDHVHFDVLNRSTKQYVGQTQIDSNGRCIFPFSIDANVYYAFIGFFIID